MTDEQRRLRKLVDCRALLVRRRSRNIVFLRASLQLTGVPVKSCAADEFVGHHEATTLPTEEKDAIVPLVEVLKATQEPIGFCDGLIIALVRPPPLVSIQKAA